ncbi:hypothetical protein GCM10023340_37460 [Nocardioides marinquilinus]|uniref:DUF4394 domain-containing protein n=1 Tax=Nocardioides marinquilinus TaxID=1210400 RepID=A0ABP9PYM3_9ACTN
MTLVPTTRLRRTLVGVVAATIAAGTTAAVVAPDGAEARPDARPAYGLTTAGKLVTFDLRRPQEARYVGTVTNLGGQDLVGIDVRPANGRLYGVGREGGVFTIDPRTARATRVGRIDQQLRGASFGVDIDPVTDQLVVVSNRSQNLRFDFADRSTASGRPLNYTNQVGYNTRVEGVTAIAFTNNDAASVTGTALYGIDTAKDRLVLQAPVNLGIITPQGGLDRSVSFRAGLDVHSTYLRGTRRTRTALNTLYATVGSQGRYGLFTADPLTGHLERVGTFPMPVADLAVVQD